MSARRATTSGSLAAGVAGFVLAIVLAWGGGLAWFVWRAQREPQPSHTADGIVALTGGAERVATALRLLADGRGRLLLISGVGPAAELADFARLAKLDPDKLAAQVTLGRDAASTRGNAAETAAWAQANRLHSLLVVTATYHMPRALLELSRAAPDLDLFPVPVRPPGLRGTPDWPMLRLLIGEYSKWLAACAGLSGVAGLHEERRRA